MKPDSSEPNVDRILESWRSERRPIICMVWGIVEPSKSCVFRGFLSAVSSAEVTLLCDPDKEISLSLSLTEIRSVRLVSFEEAVSEGTGKQFDTLKPEERGAIWAQRFDEAIALRFISGARCMIAALPLQGAN